MELQSNDNSLIFHISEYLSKIELFEIRWIQKNNEINYNHIYFIHKLKTIDLKTKELFLSKERDYIVQIINKILILCEKTTAVIQEQKSFVDSYPNSLDEKVNNEFKQESERYYTVIEFQRINKETFFEFLTAPFRKFFRKNTTDFFIPKEQYEIYIDCKFKAINSLKDLINATIQNSNIIDIEPIILDNGKLTTKQQFLLLDLLGVLDTLKGIEDTKKSQLIGKLIGKDPQNIRTCFSAINKNSRENPLHNPANPLALIELLESLELTELANNARERFKVSLAKKTNI